MKKPYNVFARVQEFAMRAREAFPFGSNTTGNPALSKLPTPKSDLSGRAQQGPFATVRDHTRHGLLIKDTTVDTGKTIIKR